MNINAIDPLYPVRADWLYPLRANRIPSVPIDPLGTPYPSEALQALALNRAERIARGSPVESAALESTREPPSAIHTSQPVQDLDTKPAPDSGQPIDWLRNQFATHRLTNAIQAFKDAQAEDKDHAGAAAVNLGTPEQPLLIHKYLVAFGNPPIEQLQPFIQAGTGPARVGPVANVAATRNVTEDALAADPGTRSRARHLRETDP